MALSVSQATVESTSTFLMSYLGGPQPMTSLDGLLKESPMSWWQKVVADCTLPLSSTALTPFCRLETPRSGRLQVVVGLPTAVEVCIPWQVTTLPSLYSQPSIQPLFSENLPSRTSLLATYNALVSWPEARLRPMSRYVTSSSTRRAIFSRKFWSAAYKLHGLPPTLRRVVGRFNAWGFRPSRGSVRVSRQIHQSGSAPFDF